MAKSRAELDAMLEDLEKYLEAISKEAGDDQFIELFAARADQIESSAGPAYIYHVHGRIDGMLNSRGMLNSCGAIAPVHECGPSV
jgi:hypothetical protein